MNRKIVMVAFGSLGDIYPLLAIAERLAKHSNVVFLANEYFKDHIVGRGIEFHSIGLIEHQLAARESEDSSGETKQGRKHRFENIIGKSFERTFEYIERQHTNGVDITVITHGNLSPATLACEKFNIPLIVTYYATSQIPHNGYDMDMYNEFHGRHSWLSKRILGPLEKLHRLFSFEVESELNEYRKQYGLAPIPSGFRRVIAKVFPKFLGCRSGVKVNLHIALLPAWFSDPVNRYFPHIEFAGFPFVTELQENPPELQEFLERHPNPIVFTPGTAVEDIQHLCREIIPICRKLGSPAILVSKHGRAAFEALKIPFDVPIQFIEHVNFEELLPKVRCLVHHGGIGTTAQAIRAGIPQIIRPRMYDQPINGLRVMMCGLGGSIPAQEFNADMFANILLHIESSNIHQERIRHFSDDVKRHNGAAACAKFIMDFIENKDSTNDAASANFAAHQL